MAEVVGSGGGATADRPGAEVNPPPSRRLYLLGAVIFAALVIVARNHNSRGAPSFLVPLLVAGVAYLLAVREFFNSPKLSRRVIIVGLAFAVAWHILFLLVPPGADDDIHRYVWDGRIQRLGYNPYLAVPNDPALAALHTGETRTMNHPDLPSLYPPMAELFFRAVAAIHESVFALKVAFVLCDLAIGLVLLDLFRTSGQAEHWVLAYAWNPLLAIEVAWSGHVDILGALLLLISFAALGRRRRAVAAIAFALAIAVKPLPLVLLPIFWKRIRLRDSVAAAVVLALACVPFLDHGRLPTGSLGSYVQSFRFNGPIFSMLAQLAPSRWIAALAVLVGIVVAIRMKNTSGTASPDAFAWPMAASLFFAPVVYPWYLLWLLPFVRSIATLPLIVWTVSILPAYYVWHLRDLGHPWLLPDGIMLLEYGSVAVAVAVIAWRRMTGRASVAPK